MGEDVRLNTEHIAHALAFVADRRRGLADGVDEEHTGHPLLGGQFDLTDEVVEMLDKSTDDEAVAVGTLGANVLNNVLGEVRIELGLAILGAGLAHAGNSGADVRHGGGDDDDV